ncbi:MAG TPA: hypothetical protein PKC67_05350 [Kiritimatiellia bacterium]|nr:hypothetical protein [Kiritimatiellia bacterium]HMP33759.1 hypothetical protein [Kiritimatiellia bacterium]
MRMTHAWWFGVALLAAGCGPGREERGAEAGPVTLSEQAVAVLAYADAHDGTVDLVVEDCANCRLGMKGKASITAKLQEYSLHCCAEHCREAVERDPERVLAKIKVK